MRISVEPGDETPEVCRFIELVWPPKDEAQSPVTHLTWDHVYQRRMLTRDDAGKIISQVALVHRDGSWNGEPLRIGGVAGVGTDPAYRGQGLATAGMKQAAEILANESFGIGALFCAAEMAPFYERLGWRSFEGGVFIAQPGATRVPWSNCMTLAVKRTVSDGALDVGGLPW